MKSDTNRYWQKLGTKESITTATRTIVHPYLNVLNVQDVVDITRSLCNTTRVRKAVKIHPILIADADHNYIWMN